MRPAARIATLVLAVLIGLTTSLAFWAFTLNRVILDSQTYKTPFDSPNFHATLLPVLLSSALQSSGDSPIRLTAGALFRNLSLDDRIALADKLFPPYWFKSEVDGNIDRLFIWLSGQRLTPDINFDLTEARFALTNPASAREAAAIIVPGAPLCKPDQSRLILSSIVKGDPGQWTAEDFNLYPVCNPSNGDLHQRSINVAAAALVKIGQALPDRWDLSQELGDFRPAADQFGPEDLVRFRATLWLIGRLIVLLFLIPISLFALLMLFAIRSSKAFLRWLGASLVLSGLLTLVPVVLLPLRVADLYKDAQKGIETGFGASGQLINTLLAGMARAVDLQTTPGVLMLTALAVGIGIAAIFIAVILRQPEPVIEKSQVVAEQVGSSTVQG